MKKTLHTFTMKKTLNLLLLLGCSTSSAPLARAITADALDLHMPTQTLVLSPEAQEALSKSQPLLYSATDWQEKLHGKEGVNVFKQRYKDLFEALSQRGPINYKFLSYVLNKIETRSPKAISERSEPDMLLKEAHLQMATEFLHLTDEEVAAKRYTRIELQQMLEVFTTVTNIYLRYEGTLESDPQNFKSVRHARLIEEGILSVAAVEWQQTTPLAGVIAEDPLSLVRHAYTDSKTGKTKIWEHSDITKKTGIVLRVASAFTNEETQVMTVPFNLNNGHWIMLAVQQDGQVVVIDSMSSSRTYMAKPIVELLNEAQIKDAKGNIIEFTLYNGTGSYNTNLQFRDGVQCGIHALAYCYAIAAQGSIEDGIRFIHSHLETGKTRRFEDIALKRETRDDANDAAGNIVRIPAGFGGKTDDKDLFAQALRLDLEQKLRDLFVQVLSVQPDQKRREKILKVNPDLREHKEITRYVEPSKAMAATKKKSKKKKARAKKKAQLRRTKK